MFTGKMSGLGVAIPVHVVLGHVIVIINLNMTQKNKLVKNNKFKHDSINNYVI